MCVCVAEAIESMTIGWLIGREKNKGTDTGCESNSIKSNQSRCSHIHHHTTVHTYDISTVRGGTT